MKRLTVRMARPGARLRAALLVLVPVLELAFSSAARPAGGNDTTALAGSPSGPGALPAPAVCDAACAGGPGAFLWQAWTYARKPGQTYDYRTCDPNERTREGEACRAIGLVLCDGTPVGVATVLREEVAGPAQGPDVIVGAGHSFVDDRAGQRRRNCHFLPNGTKGMAYPISYLATGPLEKDRLGRVVAGDYAVGLVDGGVGSKHGAVGYRSLAPDRLAGLAGQGAKLRQMGFLPRLGRFVISDNGLPLDHGAPQLGSAERDQYRHSFNTVVGFSGGPQMISTGGAFAVYCIQVKMMTDDGTNQDNRPFDARRNPSACTRIDGAFRAAIAQAFGFARTGRARDGSFERMVFDTR